MPHAQAIHLHPTAPLADRVLLPGDPGRALALAQALLVTPRMFNHNRGLWGYTGTAPDGDRLTIQSTGMGGPSAAIVLTELIALGATRAIRVGTCGALSGDLALGELLIARESICADGTSRALGSAEIAQADALLTQALARQAPAARVGRIVSVDLFYDEGRRVPTEDALAIEMEAATLFSIGAATGVKVACMLAVSDTFEALGESPGVPDGSPGTPGADFEQSGGRVRIADDALAEAAERMGAAAMAALSE